MTTWSATWFSGKCAGKQQTAAGYKSVLNSSNHNGSSSDKFCVMFAALLLQVE